ncbi:MAG: hypothetical protein AAGL10_12975 [Pseudomonadota bacterium]
MKRIGFLACDTTLPGAGIRREDAFEHDLMIAALAPAFAVQGLELNVIDWEAPMEAFAGIDLVQLGTAWNYQDKSDAFLAKLDALSAQGIHVCNAPDIVRWNITKTYLRDLQQRGAKTIPTIWLDNADKSDAEAAIAQFGCKKLVVKRQIGAGAEGQELLETGEIADGWHFNKPAMLQPFLPAIAEQGELSFIFIDGELSHTLRKRAASGEYRIQSLYGGVEEKHSPSHREVSQAEAIIAALPFETPLYARIDMLGDENGDMALMEAELIEPYLYPEQGPELGERLGVAINKRVKSQ